MDNYGAVYQPFWTAPLTIVRCLINYRLIGLRRGGYFK